VWVRISIKRCHPPSVNRPATRCNTLQHDATHCNICFTIRVRIRVLAPKWCSNSCSVLQCTAVCCRAIYTCGGTKCNRYAYPHPNATGWRRTIRYLTLPGHFPRKSPIVRSSFMERDFQNKASNGSPPRVSRYGIPWVTTRAPYGAHSVTHG